MEKPELSKEELGIIREQYFSLTSTLNEYRENMKGIKYIRSYSKMERLTHKAQRKFFTFSLNETIKCLIDQDFADYGLLVDALRNRFVNYRTKLTVIKALLKIDK